MNAVVDKLKELNIDKIGSLKVVATRDYSKGIKRTEIGQEEMDTV